MHSAALEFDSGKVAVARIPKRVASVSTVRGKQE